MLENLIPSKVRRKILKLFFHNLFESYYLREVVRLVNEEVNAVKRELDILQDSKVLHREKRLNKVYYSLNKNYIFYEEFLRIFAKKTFLAEQILNNLSRLGKIKYAALSLKFVKKAELKEDEIYLLFVGVVVVPEVEIIMKEVKKDYPFDINYTVMTADEVAFRKKNNDPFIWKFLKEPKVMLVGQEEDLMK